MSLTAKNFMVDDKMEVEGGGIKRQRGRRRRNANPKKAKSSQHSEPGGPGSDVLGDISSTDNDSDSVQIEAYGQQVSDIGVRSQLTKRSPVKILATPDRKVSMEDKLDTPAPATTTAAIASNSTETPAVPPWVPTIHEPIVFVRGLYVNLTKRSTVRVQREIYAILNRTVQIKISGESLRITCQNDAEKQKLMLRKEIDDCEVIFSEPYHKRQKNYKKGIIFGVSKDITDEEICKETQANTAKRIKSKFKGVLAATERVLLDFPDSMPTHVYIGYKRHKVSEYIPEPLRCFNCQRFGHKAVHCKSRVRCSICAGGHSVKTCTEINKPTEESKTHVCANCNGPHPTSYRGCGKFQEAKVATKLQFSGPTRISYAEAIKKVRTSAQSAQTPVAIPEKRMENDNVSTEEIPRNDPRSAPLKPARSTVQKETRGTNTDHSEKPTPTSTGAEVSEFINNFNIFYENCKRISSSKPNPGMLANLLTAIQNYCEVVKGKALYEPETQQVPQQEAAYRH